MKRIIIIVAVVIALAYFIRPPVTGGRLSSMFGIRFAGSSIIHTGSDFALPTGSPVSSTSWGTVRSAEFSELAGNQIIISHVPGISGFSIVESRYQHLDTMNVRPGQKVNPGTVIGTVGNTGFSTGSHLHFEIRLLRIPLPPYLLTLPGRIFNLFGGYKMLDSKISGNDVAVF